MSHTRAAAQHAPQRSAYHREQTGSLPPRVAAVMERWERGEAIEKIAAALGQTPQAIAKVVTNWDECDLRPRTRRAAERGSQMLLAAIRQLQSNHHREQGASLTNGPA